MSGQAPAAVRAFHMPCTCDYGNLACLTFALFEIGSCWQGDDCNQACTAADRQVSACCRCKPPGLTRTVPVQGPKFSEQVATLESEVRSFRQSNAKLTEDNKAAAAMIRNKDRELDAAALRVEEAERVMIMNRVCCSL